MENSLPEKAARLRYLLFAGVLAAGAAVGFSVGHYSGFMEAKRASHAEQFRMYSGIIRKAERGKPFSLWGIKLIPVDSGSLRICRAEKPPVAAKNLAEYKEPVILSDLSGYPEE